MTSISHLKGWKMYATLVGNNTATHESFNRVDERLLRCSCAGRHFHWKSMRVWT